MPPARLEFYLRTLFFIAFLVMVGLSLWRIGSAGKGVAVLGPKKRAECIDTVLAPLNFKTGRLLVERRPHADWRGMMECGNVHWRRGESLAALEEFVRAVTVTPEQPEVYLPLARWLRRAGRDEAAEATLRTALDLAFDDPQLTQELAILLTSQGRRREAVEFFRRSLNEAPDDGDVQARLAVELYYLGDLETAADHLTMAVERNGRIPGALPGLLASTGAPVTRGPTGHAVETKISAPVRIDAGGAAQATETAVAGDGTAWVAAWNDQRDGAVSAVWRLGAALSSDGAATWDEGLIRPTGGQADDFEGDPFAAYDSRTGNAWVGGVHFYSEGSIFVARRRPGASAFDAPVLASKDPNSFYDKPLMAVGRGPQSANTTVLYITYSDGLIASSDFGETWSPTVLILPHELYNQPRVGPDGVLSILSWDAEDGIWLRQSHDGGATLGERRLVATRLDVWRLDDYSRVPGEFRVPPLPCLAIGAEGTFYVVYPDTTAVRRGDADLDLYLTRSYDGGLTWTPPHPILEKTSAGDEFAPWLEVDPSGRLHLAFFDTRYHSQDDQAPAGLIDVSYAFSDDDGASWHDTRVTETSSSSEDAIWIAGEVLEDYQFVGDYLGLAFSSDHRPIVVYSAASGGDFDIYSRRLGPPVFVDGFESEGLRAWTTVRLGDVTLQ